MPFCYLPASYSMFVVRERVIKHKHLLLVSGTRAPIYWLSTYTFDMGQYLFVTLASMAVFLAYGDNIYVENTDSALGAMTLLLMYGCALLPPPPRVALTLTTPHPPPGTPPSRSPTCTRSTSSTTPPPRSASPPATS